MKNYTNLNLASIFINVILLCLILVGSCSTKLMDNKETVTTSGVDANCISIAAEKMNVLYIGVENPIIINAPNVEPEKLKVSVGGNSGASIIKGNGDNGYISVSKPGECAIIVKGGGFEKTETYRVKRIPNPIARLSKSQGGTMGSVEFKAQGGVSAILENFDFDAKCRILVYALNYIAKGQDVVSVHNTGARYNSKSKRIISRAKRGDIYFFDNIRARCPGDVAGRTINTMVFKIK